MPTLQTEDLNMGMTVIVPLYYYPLTDKTWGPLYSA